MICIFIHQEGTQFLLTKTEKEKIYITISLSKVLVNIYQSNINQKPQNLLSKTTKESIVNIIITLI